jgi:hypothetical protein
MIILYYNILIDFMALVAQSRNELIERVYSVIQQNSGKVRSLDLDRIIGDQQEVRFAITRLTVMGRISRKRGFGVNGVEYFYHDVSSASFEKHRRIEMKMIARPFQKVASL